MLDTLAQGHQGKGEGHQGKGEGQGKGKGKFVEKEDSSKVKYVEKGRGSGGFEKVEVFPMEEFNSG